MPGSEWTPARVDTVPRHLVARLVRTQDESCRSGNRCPEHQDQEKQIWGPRSWDKTEPAEMVLEPLPLVSG